MPEKVGSKGIWNLVKEVKKLTGSKTNMKNSRLVSKENIQANYESLSQLVNANNISDNIQNLSRKSINIAAKLFFYMNSYTEARYWEYFYYNLYYGNYTTRKRTITEIFLLIMNVFRNSDRLGREIALCQMQEIAKIMGFEYINLVENIYANFERNFSVTKNLTNVTGRENHYHESALTQPLSKQKLI